MNKILLLLWGILAGLILGVSIKASSDDFYEKRSQCEIFTDANYQYCRLYMPEDDCIVWLKNDYTWKRICNNEE